MHRPPWSRSLRRALQGLALVGGVYLGLSAGMGAWLVHSFAFRPRKPVTSTPGDLAERARPVTFRARDGVRLEGFLADPAPGRPVVVVNHGIGGNRDEIMSCARVLARSGYGVLTFDWRSHGASEGGMTTFGVREARDLEGALDLLGSLPGTRGRPVGVLSVSLGASVSASAAPLFRGRVASMVLDSPFGRMDRMVADKVANLGPLAPGVSRAIGLFSHMVIGRRLEDIAPERDLAAFAPRPLLVFHGAGDDLIPVGESQSILALHPRAESWITEGDGHLEAHSRRTTDWMRRVADFFERTLEGAPSARRVLGNLPADVT